MIVGGALIAIQAVILFLQSGSEPVTIRQAIESAVDDQNLPPRRREQVRIQLAVADFMAANQGSPPESLGELVPKYFDTVPIDPDTGDAFIYTVKDGKYYVGMSKEQIQATSSKGKGKGKGKDKQADSDAPLSKDEQQALLASLNEEPEEEQIYDPTGKRDPFRPFDLTPKSAIDDGTKTPLERYSIGQLRLTAVLDGFEEPKAIIENQAGKGFTAKKGTLIGPNGGEIVEILPGKILILETTVDFTGQKKTNTIEMTLRTKDQE